MLCFNPLKQMDFDATMMEAGYRKRDNGNFVPLGDIAQEFKELEFQSSFLEAGIRTKGFLATDGSMYLVHADGIVDKFEVGENGLTIVRDLKDPLNSPSEAESVPQNLLSENIDTVTASSENISLQRVADASLCAQRLRNAFVRDSRGNVKEKESCDIRFVLNHGDEQVVGQITANDLKPTIKESFIKRALNAASDFFYPQNREPLETSNAPGFGR